MQTFELLDTFFQMEKDNQFSFIITAEAKINHLQNSIQNFLTTQNAQYLYGY
jgi:hypothetical protein